MTTRSYAERGHGPIVAAVCAFAFASVAATASEPGTRAPQIVTSGTAEVEIPATTARFSIAISERAASAAQAGSQSTLTAREVSRALKAAGITGAEIAASRLTVGPVWAYDEKSGRQRRIAFEATTTMQIETNRLEQLGTYLDAALSAGATQISEIEFSARDVDEARRRALAEALARAQGDAQVIAHAAGGHLGAPLLLTTEPTAEPRPIGFQPLAVAAARGLRAAAPPDILPSRINVTARVVGHWAFIADRSAH